MNDSDRQKKVIEALLEDAESDLEMAQLGVGARSEAGPHGGRRARQSSVGRPIWTNEDYTAFPVIVILDWQAC